MAITLSIHQERGQVGIQTQPRQFELKRTPAEVTIGRTPPEMNMTVEQGQVSIDWTAMRNSLGYGNAEFFLQNAAAEARQVYESGLEQAVSQGDALAQLSKKVTFSQLASQSPFLDHSMPDPCLEYIEPAQIHYELGNITYNNQLGQVKIHADMGKVEMLDFKPAVVDIYPEREPVLEITTKGWAFDFRV